MLKRNKNYNFFVYALDVKGTHDERFTTKKCNFIHFLGGGGRESVVPRWDFGKTKKLKITIQKIFLNYGRNRDTGGRRCQLFSSAFLI